MENGLKFVAGMFWIMFLDVEEVSKGDYRTLVFPPEDFKTSKNFYLIHKSPIQSILIYWYWF